MGVPTAIDAPGGAPARTVDNAGALPTARAFAHKPTAFDHGEIKTSNQHPPLGRGITPHCLTTPW